MRPGQGNRRPRRNGGGHSHSHGGSHGGHHSRPHQQQHRSAMSLRNQIFDSNGPDMRVRGNAFQVHEKYLALAKDALSSGDRVLAENYLQHAEHYYRIVEAINEATAAEQRQRQAAYEQPAMQQQPQPAGNGGFYNAVGDMGVQGGGVQTPLNSLRNTPVTMESAALPDGAVEGEEEEMAPMADSAPAAALGRR